MKLMVFDVGGTEIKYSVMDESLERKCSGSVPTPMDSREELKTALAQTESALHIIGTIPAMLQALLTRIAATHNSAGTHRNLQHLPYPSAKELALVVSAPQPA